MPLLGTRLEKFFLGIVFNLASLSIDLPGRGLAFKPFWSWKNQSRLLGHLWPKVSGNPGRLSNPGSVGIALVFEMDFLSTNTIFGGRLFLLAMVNHWLSHLGLRNLGFTRRVSRPSNKYFIDPPCVLCRGNFFVSSSSFITRIVLLTRVW